MRPLCRSLSADIPHMHIILNCLHMGQVSPNLPPTIANLSCTRSPGQTNNISNFQLIWPTMAKMFNPSFPTRNNNFKEINSQGHPRNELKFSNGFFSSSMKFTVASFLQKEARNIFTIAIKVRKTFPSYKHHVTSLQTTKNAQITNFFPKLFEISPFNLIKNDLCK